MKIQYALPLALGHLHSGKAAVQATLKAVRFEPSSLWPPLGISQWQSVACLFSLAAYYKNCCLQRFVLLALVRRISARAGQHQSGHYGKAGATDCNQPRKPSDFTNRRKQPSPGPLTGLYLFHLSSRLPRRKSPGLCCFLKNIYRMAEDGMVKESKLPAAQHGQLYGSAGGCLCSGTVQLAEHRHSTGYW